MRRDNVSMHLSFHHDWVLIINDLFITRRACLCKINDDVDIIE